MKNLVEISVGIFVVPVVLVTVAMYATFMYATCCIIDGELV